MIKVPLTLHDPEVIYDYFKDDFGNISMLIKGNYAIIRFQNPSVIRQIMENPKKIVRGLPLNVRPFQEKENQKNTQQNREGPNSILNNTMDLQDKKMSAQQSLLLGEIIELPNVNQRIKRIGILYEQKIKWLKETFLDEQICNRKITQFNVFLTKYLKRTQNTFFLPFKNLILTIKQYSGNNEENIIDLEPNFATRSFANRSSIINNTMIPHYNEGITYSTTQVQQVKRLCLLNETDFVSTLKMHEKTQKNGQVRIYRKDQIAPKFSLDIPEGAYSLMNFENLVFVGDYNGNIHFIDIGNQNVCDFSNKLNNGLIVQMQNYENKGMFPSIITLLQGVRNDYKIKLFEIQKQNISPEVNSLTFHPTEEMLCEGITMTVEVLEDGKFVYGCGRNTYVCPSFDKSRRDYITHEKNVMKIKKRNNQELIEAIETKILLTDLRVTRIKNDIFEFNHDINTIELLSEQYIFYGGRKGQIGLIDCRKPNTHIWNPQQTVNQGKISDILKIGNDVITCDNSGIICEWKNQDFK